MKHAKHTPGPWIVVHDAECNRICIDDANGHFVSPICELSLSDTTPHAEANARLIASAPMLLEALSLMIDHTQCAGMTLEQIRFVNAVLDRADGGTNE